MPILLFNVSWMTFNSLLAALAVLLGYFFLQSRSSTLKVLFGISWLLFLPNTIYLFTDLQHIIEQWTEVTSLEAIVLLLQYILLQVVGVITFILAFHPFERIIKRFSALKKYKIRYIVLFNFLIALGLVLGRVERINSWEVVTNPLRVIASAFHVFMSLDLLLLTLLFGIVCNCVYFLFRDMVFYRTRKYMKRVHGALLLFLD